MKKCCWILFTLGNRSFAESEMGIRFIVKHRGRNKSIIVSQHIV